MTDKAYFAFISYTRHDEEWAKWLAHELEHYHLPMTLNGRDDLPQDLRPIFRDIDELSAGNLPQQIHQALESSKNLIVVCSPHSAQSPWVNKEVEEFIRMGKTDKIFPFIVDGVAYSKNPDEECLPAALRGLTDDNERLGANVKEYKDGPQRLCKDCPLPKGNNKQGDINDKGRDAAVVKIVAGMLGLGFDMLWQRYEKEKAEEEQRIKEQRDNLLKIHSRLLAEKAIALSRTDGYMAQLLALEALPHNLLSPERPRVAEAEYALRVAVDAPVYSLKHKATSVAISPDGQKIASASDDHKIRIWDRKDGTVERVLEGHTERVLQVLYSPNEEHLISTAKDGYIRIWNAQTGKLIHSIYEESLKEVIANLIIKSEPMTINTGQRLDAILSVFETTPKEKRVLPSKQTGDDPFHFFAGPVQNLEVDDNKTRVAYSTDIAISADGRVLASIGTSRTILIWDTETGELQTALESPFFQNKVLSLSPSGKKLIVAGMALLSPQYIAVWDIPQRKLLYSKELELNGLYSAVFNVDESQIMVGCNDSLALIDSDTGKVEETISMQLRSSYRAFFSSNYRYIITASEKSVDLWDSKKMELIKTLVNHDDEITSIAVASDSDSMVSYSVDGTIRISDFENATSFDPFIDRGIDVPEDICCEDYSPDGFYKLIGTSQDLIKIKEALTGDIVYSVECGFFDKAHFSQDGRRIIASTRFKTQIWDFLPLQELIDQTRERFKKRPLTPEERKKYYLD